MPDAKLRIAYNFDTWDAGTFTASSEASASLGAGNVVDDSPSKIWRATGAQSEWLECDLGSSANLTFLGLVNHNLSAGASITLEANDTGVWSPTVYSASWTVATDSDGVPFKGIFAFPNETYRYWRWVFSDYPANTCVQVGRALGGTYYEVTRNYRDKAQIRWSDPSEMPMEPGAFTRSRSRTRYRNAVVDFRFTDRTMRDKMQTIFRKVGNENPMVISLDPSNYPSQESLYCRLTTPMSMVDLGTTYWDVATLQFEEMTR